MRINIQTIPHAKQRYETVGDYWVKDGVLEIRVSELPDWRYELLVAIHELAEYYFCKNDGVSERSIYRFDVKYENARARGKYTSDQEPGDDPDAPYTKQHQFATIIERTAAMALGVSWGKYNAACVSL